MKNQLSNVLKAFGQGFIPGMSNVYDSIRNWAQNSIEEARVWGQKTAAYVTYVKDVFVSLITFLAGDWQMSLHYVLDVSKELFKGFGDAIYVIMDNVISRIGALIKSKLIGAVEDAIAYQIALSSPPKEIANLPSNLGAEARRSHAEQTVKMLQEARRIEAEKRVGIQPLGPQLSQITTRTAESIRELVPPELAADFQTAGDTLNATLDTIRENAQAAKGDLENGLVNPFVDASQAADNFEAKMAKNTAQRQDTINRDWSTMFTRVRDSWANSLQAMMDGTVRFGQGVKDMLAGVGDAFLAMISEIMARWLLFQALTGLNVNPSVVGIQQGFIGAPKATIPTTPISSVTRPPTSYNAGMGAGGFHSVKLHEGLRPDEFYAKIQRGEQIIAKAEEGESSQPGIEINNYTETPITQKDVSFDGKKWTISLVAQNATRGGILRGLTSRR
jgi:hypothetical protein